MAGGGPFRFGHVLGQSEGAGVDRSGDDGDAGGPEFGEVGLDHDGQSPDLASASSEDDVVAELVLEFGLEGGDEEAGEDGEHERLEPHVRGRASVVRGHPTHPRAT